MNAFNPAHFRAQFPALADAGVYLDSAATALKPQAVIDASDQFYRLSAGNVHRSQFAAAQRLTRAATRRPASVWRRWLNAPSGKDIVWTRGTTEAINMVAQSYVRPRLQPGDEIIVSEAEHHANLVPWLMVAGQTGARVVKLPLGRRPPAGYRQPQRAHHPAQPGAGHRPDVQRHRRLPGPGAGDPPCSRRRDGSDGRWRPGRGAFPPLTCRRWISIFTPFPAISYMAPTGIGALYGKSELLAAMSPWLGGGKMIAEVSFDGFTPQPAPYGLEAGTPNVAGVIGLSAALEWLAQSDIGQAENWSRSLASLAEEALAKRPGFRSFRCQQSSLLAFEFDGVHHSDLVTLLAESGIALRAGQHCAQPLLAALGVSGTLRASFAPYNTQDDVAALVHAVDRALEILVD